MVDDWVPLSPEEFAKRAAGEAATGVYPIAPDNLIVVDALEERLRAAQREGLEANLRRQLGFVGPLPVVEFQSLGVRRRSGDTIELTRAAHGRSLEEVVALCEKAEGFIAHGVYIMPALLRPGVETRHASPGTWFDLPKGGGTTDSDVAARRILAIDFDAKRPSNTSATDEEMGRSVQAALTAWKYLSDSIGSDASMAYLHSGNGRQIHLALADLPVEEARATCAAVLAGMASLFDVEQQVTVDTKLFDAKRILPACGTGKKKGAPGIAERPHRRTAIVAPVEPVRLTLEQLRELGRKLWNDTNDAGRSLIADAYGIKMNGSVQPITANPDSPFAKANTIEPQRVAEWLGLYDSSGSVVCPGCGETSGVNVLKFGLKCHHNRCQGKGRNGFRTNVDLVAEVHRVEPIDAAKELGKQFGFEANFTQQSQAPALSPAPQQPPPSSPTPGVSFAPVVQLPAYELRTIAEILPKSVDRADRRARGIEKPVPLPWKSLLGQYGGGYWPGVHYLCSGTGIGKTAAALQIALNAAMAQVPTAYVGLELEDVQIGMRLVSERARIPWSKLYTGQADQWQLEQARAASLAMMEMNLPLHPVFASPRGWPAKELSRLCQAMRARYPEPDGPGSRPMLLIVDFLQIIGREANAQGRMPDMRELISDAAYYARDVASSQNVAVLVISSIARDKYTTLANATQQAGITFDIDDKGRPIFRRLKNPDALVGLGKESGDIEYSGDSVSVIARAPNDNGIFWITAKGRATGAEWSPMVFTGYRYEEPLDEGVEFAGSLKSLTKRREDAQQAVAQQKLDRATEDAISTVLYVVRNPDAGVRAVRFILGDDPKRWNAAIAVLGAGLVQIPAPKKGMKSTLRVDLSKLPQAVRQRVDENFGSQSQGSQGRGVDVNRGQNPRSPDRGQNRGVDGGLGGTPSTSTVPRSGSTTESVDRGDRSPRSAEEDADELQTRPLGTDPAAWATEKDWDDDRIQRALAVLAARFTDEEPPEGSEP